MLGNYLRCQTYHEDVNVLFAESLTFNEVVTNVANIVVAPRELSLLSNVVDTNQDGMLAATIASKVKVLLNVHLARRRQLGDLSVGALLVQDLAHVGEDLHKAHVFASFMVESLQQSRSACTSSLSGWVWELELVDVGYVRGSLMILASANHSHVGRNDSRGIDTGKATHDDDSIVRDGIANDMSAVVS